MSESRKPAVGTVIAIIQTCNIILAALIYWACFFYGKSFLLAYALSLFPIQCAAFGILLMAQVIRFFQGVQRHALKKKDYIIHSLPLITVCMLFLILQLAVWMQWNDPFSDDHFRIDATFHKDGTCDILFNGVKRSNDSSHSEYRWGCGVGVTLECKTNHTGQRNLIMTFPDRLHQLPLPIHYSIESDQSADPLKSFGVTYVDAELSNQYRASSMSGVKWELYSGDIHLNRVDTIYAGQRKNCMALQQEAIIVGHFSGYAKRDFSAP